MKVENTECILGVQMDNEAKKNIWSVVISRMEILRKHMRRKMEFERRSYIYGRTLIVMLWNARGTSWSYNWVQNRVDSRGVTMKLEWHKMQHYTVRKCWLMKLRLVNPWIFSLGDPKG
jgi:hypothetical protein